MNYWLLDEILKVEEGLTLNEDVLVPNINNYVHKLKIKASSIQFKTF